MITYPKFHFCLPLLLTFVVGMLYLGSTTTPAAAATLDSATTAFDCTAVTTIPPTECEALVMIYTAMGGEQWYQVLRPEPTYPRNSWLQLANPCDWYGVSCDEGHVRRLFFDLQGMSGAFPAESQNLSQLHMLTLSNEDVLPQANYLPALTKLQLLNATKIPAKIGNLPALQAVDAAGSSIAVIDPAIGQLTNLRDLSLSLSDLQEPIPDAFGSLAALEALTLTRPSGTLTPITLPATLGNLHNLSQLTISGPLATLPNSFGDLETLNLLVLTGNSLRTLPETVGNLHNLRWLILSANELTSLPASIGNLTNLIFLDVAYNQLTALPAEIGNLQQLERLRADDNQLQTLPTTIGNLSSLNSLELTRNQLVALPPELGNLTGLRALKLGSNQLTTLPAAIGNLQALPDLELADNQLTALPDTFSQLVNITTVVLYDNKFTTFPAVLSKMPNLETLWLNRNAFTLLPTDLTLPPNLSRLFLSNNSELVGPIPHSFTQLSTFEAYFTQLCADSDPAFQAWVEQVTGDDPYLRPCPTLAVDATTGAPGSQFTLVGTNFGNCCVTWTVTVTVNSVVIGTFPVVHGEPFSVTLTTSDTVAGRYVVNAGYGLPAWTYGYSPQLTLTLDQNAPLRTPSPVATHFALPPGLIYQKFIYLPLLAR